MVRWPSGLRRQTKAYVILHKFIWSERAWVRIPLSSFLTLYRNPYLVFYASTNDGSVIRTHDLFSFGLLMYLMSIRKDLWSFVGFES